MANYCAELAGRLGADEYAQLTQAKPCEAWDVAHRQQLVQQVWPKVTNDTHWKLWQAYLGNHGPGSDVQPPRESDEWLEAPFRLGPGTSQGFAQVRLAPEKDMHEIHPEHRNEWWQLQGVVGQHWAVTWWLWRHTLLPPTLWNPDADPLTYSVFTVVTQTENLTTGEVSTDRTVWRGAWGGITLETEPFCFAVDGHYGQLTSRFAQHMFPLTWTGQHKQEHRWTFQLDSLKPRFMYKSNGCVECHDGVGLKRYMYPMVTGAGQWNGQVTAFRGTWSHSWSAGWYPRGLPYSASYRTFQQIQHYVTGVPARSPSPVKNDTLTLHLDNGCEVVIYGLASQRYVEAQLVQPDNVIQRLRLYCQVLAREAGEDAAAVTNVTFRHERFACQWWRPSRKAPPTNITSNLHTRFLLGRVQGTLDRQPVAGVGFLQSGLMYTGAVEAQTNFHWAWVAWVCPFLLMLTLCVFIVITGWQQIRLFQRRHPGSLLHQL